MATHNHVHLVGYLKKDPMILNQGIPGAEKIFIWLQTVRRDAEDVEPRRFEQVIVFYDGEELAGRMKALKMLDMIELKGVFSVMPGRKESVCPECGQKNVKEQGVNAVVYPLWMKKLDNMENSYGHSSLLPDAILFRQYREVSNYIMLIGTLVNDPVLYGTEKKPICRYQLGIDRKYYIHTQPDLKADYPWVYSRGQQALDDSRHLQKTSVIMVDGYIHTRSVKVPVVCAHCGQTYQYPDVVTDLIPYSIEYLRGHLTDEDLAREEELKRLKLLSGE